MIYIKFKRKIKLFTFSTNWIQGLSGGVTKLCESLSNFFCFNGGVLGDSVSDPFSILRFFWSSIIKNIFSLIYIYIEKIKKFNYCYTYHLFY